MLAFLLSLLPSLAFGCSSYGRPEWRNFTLSMSPLKGYPLEWAAIRSDYNYLFSSFSNSAEEASLKISQFTIDMLNYAVLYTLHGPRRCQTDDSGRNDCGLSAYQSFLWRSLPLQYIHFDVKPPQFVLYCEEAWATTVMFTGTRLNRTCMIAGDNTIVGVCDTPPNTNTNCSAIRTIPDRYQNIIEFVSFEVPSGIVSRRELDNLLNNPALVTRIEEGAEQFIRNGPHNGVFSKTQVSIVTDGRSRTLDYTGNPILDYQYGPNLGNFGNFGNIG